jgi:LuxR family maltose regulon positive regulatory protein
VPLDRTGQWYRYHHLFRDMLLAELNRQEPQIVPVLQRRAAAWCHSHGLPEEALEYFIAAGDTAEAAALVDELWVRTCRQGRVTTVRRWVQWLDERGETGEQLRLVVLAGLMAAITGRPAEAERWADALDLWQQQDPDRAEDPVAEGWAAVLRAEMCRRGVKRMRVDAAEAASKLAGQNVLAPVAVTLQGMACLLSGDIDGSDAFFADAATIAKEVGSHFMLHVGLAERAVVAMARGEWNRAQAFADQARAVVRQTGVDEASDSADQMSASQPLAWQSAQVETGTSYCLRSRKPGC